MRNAVLCPRPEAHLGQWQPLTDWSEVAHPGGSATVATAEEQLPLLLYAVSAGVKESPENWRGLQSSESTFAAAVATSAMRRSRCPAASAPRCWGALGFSHDKHITKAIKSTKERNVLALRM